MEELKRMLEAIHRENKNILTLLYFWDEVEEDQTDEIFKEIVNEIDGKYDALFYGKENTDERFKNWSWIKRFTTTTYRWRI